MFFWLRRFEKPSLQPALPPRLHDALERELCPGEEVRLAVQPAAASGACLLARLGGLAGTVAALAAVAHFLLAAGDAVPVPGLFSFFAGAFAFLLDYSRNRERACIATNRRCFEMRLRSGVLHVRDVRHLPLGLPGQQKERIRAEIEAWRANPGGVEATGAGGTARLVRPLPDAVRQRLERYLQPEEEILWADQPTPRDYLIHAPLDGWATLCGLAAGVLPLVALVGSVAYGPEFALRAGAAALAAAGLTAWRLWRQIRHTVYAVTTRQGLILTPGSRTPRTFSHKELRRFQRTQQASGRGTLLLPLAQPGEGFYGVRGVKAVDDLIKGRPLRDQSGELTPAEAPPGRGDELSAGR